MPPQSPHTPPPHLWLDGDPFDGRTAVREHQPPPPPPPPAPPAPAPRRRGRAALAGAAAGAASAALLTGGLFSLGVLDASEDGNGGVNVNRPALVAPSTVGKKDEGNVGAIYASALPSVASIRAGSGEGTGFVVDSSGLLVTNAHVVDGASTVQVRFGEKQDPITGRVLGSDPSTDLAVVKIEKSGLKALRLADSGGVRVGQLAVAIGSPFGLQSTATSGIVSGTERRIEAPNGFSIDSVIQTDAPINPGNSGGPLLDGKGQVIGVNSQILNGGGGGGNVGIGFAVPSNTVAEVYPRLAAGQSIDRGYLGVSSSNATSGGARVEQVTPGSPAAAAGLAPGDAITAVDGEQIRDADALTDAIAGKQPGDSVRLRLNSGRDVEVTLSERPAQVSQSPAGGTP